MLTLIINGKDHDFLARAIREVGQPDRVWVIDEDSRTYSTTTYLGTPDEETVEGLPIDEDSFESTLSIFNGDAVLVKRAGGDEILDEIFSKLPDSSQAEGLPSWTKGARFRLIEIWAMPGCCIVAEKPTPPIEDFQLGQKLRPLGQ